MPASKSSDELHTTEVTLDEIFKDNSDDQGDSFKIPGFLNK